MLGGNAAENCDGTNPATATPVHAFAAAHASELDYQGEDERTPIDLANATESSELIQLGDADLGTVAFRALAIDDDENAFRESATTNSPSVAAPMSDVPAPLAAELANMTSATIESATAVPAAAEPVAVEPVAAEPVAVESEGVELEAVELEAVELEAVALEAVASEAVEPEAVEPEAVEPEAVASEAVASEAVASEAVASESVASEAVEPVSAASEAAASEAVASEAVEPEAVEPEAVASEAVEPAAAAPEPAAPEAAAFESVAAEAVAPEAVAAETVAAETVEPAAVEPEAGRPIDDQWQAVATVAATVDDAQTAHEVPLPSMVEPPAVAVSPVHEVLADNSPEASWLESPARQPVAAETAHRITVRVPEAVAPASAGDESLAMAAVEACEVSTACEDTGAWQAATTLAARETSDSGDTSDVPDSIRAVAMSSIPVARESRPVPAADDGMRPPEVQTWRPVTESAEASGVSVRGLGPPDGLRVPPPRVLSLRIPKPTVKVSGFTFPEAPWAAAWMKPPAASDQPAAANDAPAADAADQTAATAADGTATAEERPAKLTRIKPPGDVIKLEDRLYYVLQPPLESLVSSGEIHMPFEPFPYQYEGIGFLYPRYTAVLADEMGLGKTMQAIMTIRLLLRAGEVRNVLLVCPKPLVSNWRREFQTWAPEIPVGIIEGDQARRHWQWRQASTPVKIANYELLMRDRDVLDANLHFDLVALDEAQRIKNKSSTTSEIVRSIARTRSWALTGTPVENSPEDIVGIFEFLSPGYLSNDMPPRRMGELVKDHILRRTKDMVLTDMPPKLFRDATLDLSPEQYETYRRAEDDGVMKLTDMGPGITIQHVFELVLRLKQICNFDPVTGASSKLERLEADLEEVVASGQKAILFTQWVVTIARLREKLARFGTLEYHGQLPHKQRETVIDQFKHDPSKRLIMMSYGAGSVGLNLQFCRYVFLFDRWWNPAIEDQAINRAHRIGVSGPVTVTRMITGGTIEERINQVLDEKRELFNSILSHADNSARGGLTQNEIFGLFNLKVQAKPKAA